MFKRTVTMMLAAGTLVLGGCASNGGAEQAAADNSDFGGKSIYLRGEMNDWMATDESKVVKVADKLYMAWPRHTQERVGSLQFSLPTPAGAVAPTWLQEPERWRCRARGNLYRSTRAPSMRT